MHTHVHEHMTHVYEHMGMHAHPMSVSIYLSIHV